MDISETSKPEDELCEIKPQNDQAVVYDDVFGEVTDEGPNYRNVGFVGTIVLMMKTQIGLGILAIPGALDTLGMVPGVICLVGLGCMTTWSDYMIGAFKLRHREVYGIDDAGAVMCGLTGRSILSVAFCLYYIFNSASSILGISIALNAVSMHGICTAAFTPIAAILGFGFSSIRTLGRITWLAWVGLPCIISAVMIATIAVGVEDHPASAPQTDTVWVSNWKVVGNPSFPEAMAAVSNLLFAYSGTPGFFSIVSEMRNPRQYTGAVLCCQAGVTTIYTVIGCVIYYYCGSYVASPALGSAGGLVKKISYGFALPGLIVTMTIVTHIPAKYVFVHILRGSRHLTSNSPTHWICWLSCVFGITIIAYIIASTIPVFGALISLIGALIGPLICLLPMGFMWLYDNWSNTKSKRWSFMVCWSVFVITFGTYLMVVGTWGAVNTIIIAYNNSGGASAFSCADNSNSV